MIKCKVGDKVRYLNDVGGGVVTRLISATMACVVDEDGFEIPSLISDLVVVEVVNAAPKEPAKNTSKVASMPDREVKKGIQTNKLPDKTEDELRNTPPRDLNNYEILLAFVPVKKEKAGECDADLYLINDSGYELLYLLNKWTDRSLLHVVAKGDLEADAKEHLQLIPMADLHRPQRYSFNVMMYQNTDHQQVSVEQIEIELNPINFIRATTYKENQFFDQPAYIYKLLVGKADKQADGEIVVDPIKLSEAMTAKNQAVPNINQPIAKPHSGILEIDLHIDSIEPNYKKLNNEEIFEIQKAYFIKKLDQGIRDNVQRMVFIHGVGNGRLKMEIRNLLNTQYLRKLRYQDASFKEYGYGATMVML